MLQHMVELVGLFVVIVSTVDQDVVLPVMQAMCLLAPMLVDFLGYAMLCTGYVEIHYLQLLLPSHLLLVHQLQHLL